MTVLDIVPLVPSEPLVRSLISELIVRGAALRTDIAKLVTRWEFDLSATATSQLVVTLQDKSFNLLNSGLLDRRALVQWRDLDLVVSVDETGDTNGVPYVRVTARARGVQELKKQRGATVWRNVAPHELVAAEAGKVGLASLVDPTTARRAGIQRTSVAGKPATQQESTWDVFSRLASELGFWLFESAGTVVFGRPTWIVQNAMSSRTWHWPTGGDDELQGVPVCRNSEDADTVTIDARILIDSGIDYRPGWAVNFHGIRGFEGTFIVTDMKAVPGTPLADITLATPVNPTPTAQGDQHAPIRVGPGFGTTGPILNASQIAGYAILAGFTGQAVVIITAIALAESIPSGNTLSHNDIPPDDSYGLTQVNMIGGLGPDRRARYGLSSNEDLYDPLTNLRAAFDISSGGTNFGSWTTFNNGAFLAHMSEALDGAAAPDVTVATTSASVEAFVQNAIAQAGDRFDMGAGRTSDPNPDAFDCSGLVYWAAHQVGVDAAAAAYTLWRQCVDAGTDMPVDQAISTRGALLFIIANPNYSSQNGDHVAISLGDGNTIEARNTRYGVGIFGAAARGWVAAGMLPGLA